MTDLALLLDAQEISHLVMVGAATNWCIRATAYAVLDREFDLTLVEDAHTAESFEISPTLKIDAKPVIDDLNVDI